MARAIKHVGPGQPSHTLSDGCVPSHTSHLAACRANVAELRIENARLRVELARWKPAQCGKIFPAAVPGEAIRYCAREYDHEGAHQAENGLVWVFPNERPGAERQPKPQREKEPD